jgi:tetratricopeptide (TPR) repeat protein/lysophospholipase L1-like esterase
MKKKNTPVNKAISKPKKWLFNLLIALIPVLLFVMLEFVLRLFHYGDNYSLFIDHPDDMYREYRIVNPKVGAKYFQQLEYTEPARDIFLRKKPEDCFRIFVMGSSTVIGFPYENNLMFSRILQERLQDAYPDKKIEMVNTAITAINSFTLLDFMPQILDEKPDAILVYAGHNEFYGAFGVGSAEAVSHNRILIRLHLKLMNSKLYQALRNIIGGIGRTFSAGTAPSRGTLMSKVVKKADIIYNSKDYRKGIRYFEKNYGAMLDLARKNNVPVFASDLVSNIRDIRPFKSIASGNYKEADYYYKEARAAEQKNEFQKAKENYITARDYDCIRFRASGEINEKIRSLAIEYKANYVPTLALFESNSPHQIVGNNLLTEHVHPNIEGQFLLADAFYQAIAGSGVIAGNTDELTVKPADYYRNTYGYTELDRLIGYHRIANLKFHFPFRDESKEYIDYRQIYRPVSFLDSLAFTVMASKEVSAADAHEELAIRYEGQLDYVNAYREYNALVKINPYWPANYKKAADCLINTGDLPLALKYFNRSLVYEESFYAWFRAGEIYLIKNDLTQAIRYFSKALELSGKDNDRIKVLTKLTIAYTYMNDKGNASRILQSMRQINPDIQISVPPRGYFFSSYIPVQVKPFIEQANVLLAKADPQGAERVLLGSLKINDSPVANRMLGEIYARNNDHPKALFYLRKIYGDFNTDPQYLHFMILVCLNNRQQQEADRCLSQLARIEPGYPELARLKEYVQGAPVQ